MQRVLVTIINQMFCAMKVRYSLLLLMVLLAIVSCKNKSEAPATLKGVENAEEIIAARPHAQISIPAEVDMGIFQGSEMKKTVDIQVENIGNTPLYINYLSPECNCTEVSVKDSVVAPGATTQIHATLDLSGYPADTIRKNFSVISNSQKKHVATVVLKGEVK